MRTRMEVLRGFGVVVLAACGPQAPEYDAAADVQAINEVREREWAAFSGGSVDDLVSVFASDARVMPPDAPAATGEAEIRVWGQAMADGFTIAGGYTGNEVEVVGDWAFEHYTGRMELTPAGGESFNLSVKGVHVYQRQADGSWLITHDVWNTDAPACGEQ